jgi:hypothetical protein
VGVSQDVENTLFNQHKVEEKKGQWIFRKAFSAEEAREVKKYFVKRLKTNGKSGDKGQHADMVYAYKKTSSTNP